MIKKREVDSIEVAGLNLSAPNGSAPKGSCSVLHNVRHEQGYITGVGQKQLNCKITNFDGFSIIGDHPALDDNKFIALKNGEVIVIEVVDKIACYLQKLCDQANNEVPKISHFDNFLYVTFCSYDPIVEYMYALEDGAYAKVDIDAIDPPLINVSETVMWGRDEKEVKENGTIKASVTCVVNHTSFTGTGVTKIERFDAIATGLINNEGYITGSALLFAAYKMKDGTVIKNGVVWQVGERTGFVFLNTSGNENDGYISKYYASTHGTTIDIWLPECKDKRYIESIVIYSTRLVPLYNWEGIQLKINSQTGIVSDKHDDPRMSEKSLAGPNPQIRRYLGSRIHSEEIKNIESQPFYLLKEIRLEDQNKLVNLKFSDFKDIEHKPIYKPSFSVHKTVYGSKFIYNNRLHGWRGHTNPYRGDPYFKREDEYTKWQVRNPISNDLINIDLCWVYTLMIEGKEYKMERTTPAYFSSEKDGVKRIVIPQTVAYPDARATRCYLYAKNTSTGKAVHLKAYTLKPIEASNIAISTDYSIEAFGSFSTRYTVVQDANDGTGNGTCYFGGVVIDVGNEPQTGWVETITNDNAKIIKSENKLDISISYNPFSFDPRNSYSLDRESKIYGVESSADQLTETRFGAHPLYLFANKGIIAMEAGTGEVLYSKHLPITNEVIERDMASVSARGVVLYTSAEGVMIIRGRTVECVSSPIKSEEFAEYITGAHILYDAVYNEVLVFNEKHLYAYVLSLNSMLWSTRDLQGKYIGSGLIASDKGVESIKRREDISSPRAAEIVLRGFPLSGLDYARVEGVRARMDNAPLCDLAVEGSNDGQEWYKIAATSGSIIRRTCASHVYHRISISVASGYDLKLKAFDIEWYRRFGRHLIDMN